MSLRIALGLFGVMAATESALAAPPVNPQVEGREPNPVIRDFYLPDSPPFEYGAGPVAPGEALSDRDWLAVAVWDLLMDRLTMPLGMAEVWD